MTYACGHTLQTGFIPCEAHPSCNNPELRVFWILEIVLLAVFIRVLHMGVAKVGATRAGNSQAGGSQGGILMSAQSGVTPSPHAVDTDSGSMCNVVTEANMIQETRVFAEA
jgi:hypothetical protein